MGNVTMVQSQSLASESMIEACWPEDIPRNYKEMEKQYGGFVAATLRKYNKVNRNFSELLAHIWMRLIHVDVIGKFMASVAEKMPRTMTATEACHLLGVTFGQWRTKMWAYHVGDPVIRNGRMVCRKQGGWMPTPINAEIFLKKTNGKSNGYSSKNAIFASEDIMKLASDEHELKNGGVRGPFAKQGPLNLPQLKATKGHFQAYLARTIHSNFANWCRTDERKYSKDRPMFLRTDEEGEESNWEANLADPRSSGQETTAMVSEACKRLSTTLYSAMEGVPSCKPVEEHETEMFELLEDGYTLPEVVRKMDIPEKAKKAILRSVADLRSHAA
jgi:DNA-directed RNA polymerase specialized sigma24 family protein